MICMEGIEFLRETKLKPLIMAMPDRVILILLSNRISSRSTWRNTGSWTFLFSTYFGRKPSEEEEAKLYLMKIFGFETEQIIIKSEPADKKYIDDLKIFI